MKLKILMPVLIANVIVVSGLILMLTENSYNTSTYEYVPSDITKANPNLQYAEGNASMDTFNPADIKDDIAHTVIGQVVSVGDPIDWTDNGGVGDNKRGAVPVTIQVDEIVKGVPVDGKITFYLDGIYEQGVYYIAPFEPQFEIAELVLVHLVNDDFTHLGVDDFQYVALGKYGKYRIVEDKAYNEINPTGKNLDSVKNESK